ncbi:hypothetical protein [Variovorax sp. OV329]|uniref:hypothetical protein n=1 Tax=Variovorax sp. OV329 TaxID=1882825 RepID=UPI001587F565|nr:hypothetical protein [Variovorax sp. OV329]
MSILDRMAGIASAIPAMRANHEAKEHQRVEQQGLGRPIIAARMGNGYQFVAVNNRLHYSKNWKTFHDFLIYYLKNVTGADWGNAELKKPLDQRHPILQWYQKLCEQQRVFIHEPGKVSTGRMTGAVAAYMHLAYDLYALDHNADLQAKLLNRLRNQDLFAGARYEVHVAAILTRAGFSLSFENEDDRSSSHCEFVATSSTGKQFSVEAKRAESGRVQRQLVRALNKTAGHQRIVFIDLNNPDPSIGDAVPAYLQRAFDLLRRFETLDPQAKRLPTAYVFMTNTPWEHQLDSTEWRLLAIADGFHINDFKMDQVYPSIRAAVDARQPHLEMHALLESMRTHSGIPSTFDGESPELAFPDGGQQPRLTIGKRLRVPDGKGNEVEGVLASAVVVEAEKVAACAVNTDDGSGLIIKAALSDEELAAWKRHPTTFFGEVSRERKCETALDLYDFFMETYSKSSKEQLLKLLKGAEDFDTLAGLDQSELARVVCERYATSLFANVGPPPKPPLNTKWRSASPIRSKPSADE